jgi:hypothetical protein
VRYYLTLDQLSDITESYVANKQPHEWVTGNFHLAAAGEEVPAGSLELTLKVPSGMKFLEFPQVLKVEGGGTGEEEMEDEEGESSDSELSECSYVSDVRV